MSRNHYSASWRHPAEPAAECGLCADASGVGVWSKWGPGPQQESGRQFSWAEWSQAPGVGLSPGAPADLMERIHEVATALGVPLGKPASRARSAPMQRRADLDTAEPTAEELRRIRLLSALGPESRG